MDLANWQKDIAAAIHRVSPEEAFQRLVTAAAGLRITQDWLTDTGLHQPLWLVTEV